MLACRPNSDASGWCIQVRSKNNLAKRGRVLFLSFSYYPHGPLFTDVLHGCLCVFGSRFHQWKWNHDHPGMPNFNHHTVRYSIENMNTSARHFPCVFCYCCSARDYTACLRWSACFTICSHLTYPPNDLRPPNAFMYKYLAQSAPSVMQG